MSVNNNNKSDDLLLAQAATPNKEPDLFGHEFSHPADMAEHIENLPLEQQVDFVRQLSTGDAAEALAELDDDDAADVLEQLDLEEAAKLIGEMEPDDAADVLDELDEEHRDDLLNSLDHEEAEELRQLLSFDSDTAGGIMNTDVIAVNELSTSDAAILQIRREMEDKEHPYYAYIVNDQDKLQGVLSLRDLMLCRSGTILQDSIRNQDVIAVRFDLDREEVAQKMSHYNFMAIPVIDYDGHLLGMITHDDIVDVIHAEASEDMLGMVGAGHTETIETPWRESVGMRLPWLMVNMLTSALSAFVVYLFQGSIAEMAILAVLMPMVANQAGNTGQQALAVMIRQLATERFDHKKAWKAVLREGKIGLVTGCIMAFLAFSVVWGLFGNRALGLVMGGALLLDMILGALAGGAIPLIFKAMGRDPAQASSIFLTAITDGAGFFIFLGLATVFVL